MIVSSDCNRAAWASSARAYRSAESEPSAMCRTASPAVSRSRSSCSAAPATPDGVESSGAAVAKAVMPASFRNCLRSSMAPSLVGG